MKTKNNKKYKTVLLLMCSAALLCSLVYTPTLYADTAGGSVDGIQISHSNKDHGTGCRDGRSRVRRDHTADDPCHTDQGGGDTDDGADDSGFGAVSEGIDTGIKNSTLNFATNIFNSDFVVTLSSSRGGGAGTEIKTVLRYIMTILFSLVGIAAVVMLVVHGTGLIYAQMSGNVSKTLDVKGKLKDLAMGVVLLLMSYLILNFVNPRLLSPELLAGVVETVQSSTQIS